MKKCIVFFVILVAMLVLAIITGYNEPPMIDNTVVVENTHSYPVNPESSSQ